MVIQYSFQNAVYSDFEDVIPGLLYAKKLRRSESHEQNTDRSRVYIGTHILFMNLE